MSEGRIMFYVTPRPDGMWQLERGSVTGTGNIYRSKSDALNDARKLASEQTPSMIHVMDRDGNLEEEFSFPELAEEVRPAVAPKEPEGESATRC